jgi:two-component sensor histidine kinase
MVERRDLENFYPSSTWRRGVYKFASTTETRMSSPKFARHGVGEVCFADLLLRESHHRMINVLTVLQALLRRELGAFDIPEVRSAVSQLENRIVAFGDLLRLLTVSGHAHPVQVADCVGRLCQSLAIAILGPAGISCEVSVEEVLLPTYVCEQLSLVITELVMNAAKHAFRENGVRVVRIELLVNAIPGAALCLTMARAFLRTCVVAGPNWSMH